MFKRLRPSPIAVLALVVALGGTAIASAPLTDAQSNHADAKGDTALFNKLLKKANLQSRVRWAHVAADGTILSQSGGITTVLVPGGGRYYLDFGAGVNTNRKALMVSLSYKDLQQGGTPQVTRCGGGPEGVQCGMGLNNPRYVHVFTSSPSNSLPGVEHAFTVTLTP
jgi:hypothetical protein